MSKKNYKKPNFFIVGLPKSGTTALSEYLREHPDIFFSLVKEPNFFYRKDFVNFEKNPEKLDKFIEKEYLKKYFWGSKKYKIVAEGSINYLASRIAIKRIIKFNPDACFLVMIRNPLEMTPSLHSQALFMGNENVKDFEAAWYLQRKRKKGFAIPLKCKGVGSLQYGERCKAGEQIEYLYKIVKKDKVKILLYDDFKKNPKKTYENVLSFLRLKSDNRTNFPVVNPSQEVKSRLIFNFLRNRRLRNAALNIKRLLRLQKKKTGIYDKLCVL